MRDIAKVYTRSANAFLIAAVVLFSLCFSITVYAQEEAGPASNDNGPSEESNVLSSSWTDRLWTETYFESHFSKDEDNNVISDWWVKHGIHLFKWREKYVDAYLKGRVLYDRNGDFWNNRGEAGIGIRYKPWNSLGLFLFSEVLYGSYWDREGDDNNPYDLSYWDYQGGFMFWQWWGDAWWQVEGVRFYVPFKGWRELYADGLYYDRDDSNVIATMDYKEGLMLTRQGNLSFDAYVNLEAATDVNDDYWNNYVRVGPGVRVTPFTELDLKISFEYFVGDYYRGGNDGSLSDYIITVAFWHSW